MERWTRAALFVPPLEKLVIIVTDTGFISIGKREANFDGKELWLDSNGSPVSVKFWMDIPKLPE